MLHLTEEDKKYILDQHIRHISCIANKDYQERVWIRAEGPEMDSFDETVNRFFSPCESILENYKEFHLTDDQYKILKYFHDQFRIFVDKVYILASEFIDSPEWAAIMKLAGEVLQEFDYKRS